MIHIRTLVCRRHQGQAFICSTPQASWQQKHMEPPLVSGFKYHILHKSKAQNKSHKYKLLIYFGWHASVTCIFLILSYNRELKWKKVLHNITFHLRWRTGGGRCDVSPGTSRRMLGNERCSEERDKHKILGRKGRDEWEAKQENENKWNTERRSQSLA